MDGRDAELSWLLLAVENDDEAYNDADKGVLDVGCDEKLVKLE